MRVLPPDKVTTIFAHNNNVPRPLLVLTRDAGELGVLYTQALTEHHFMGVNQQVYGTFEGRLIASWNLAITFVALDSLSSATAVSHLPVHLLDRAALLEGIQAYDDALAELERLELTSPNNPQLFERRGRILATLAEAQ